MIIGVYVLHQQQGDNTEMILILYVNDLLLLGEDQSKIENIKHQLAELYHMKDLGSPETSNHLDSVKT